MGSRLAAFRIKSDALLIGRIAGRGFTALWGEACGLNHVMRTRRASPIPNEIRSFPISDSDAIEALAPLRSGDGFEVVGPDQFPTFTPPSFRDKCDSATRIVSGSGGDCAVVVYNFRRLDKSSVDEDPFAYLIVSGSQIVSGSFLGHGSWPGRTTPVSPGLAAHISGSGLGGYFLANPPDGKLSGSLSELTGSNASAFQELMSHLAPDTGR